MKKLKVVADDKIPFLKGVLEGLADISYYPGAAIGAEQVRDADALLVRTRTRCDRSLLEGSQVRFIGTATIGYDHIDTLYCEKNGIEWVSAPGCNAASVEQYIVSVILNLAVEENWRLNRLTLGVIGAGHVGSRVARAAAAMGMKVLLNDPPRERKEGPEQFTPLDDLLERADIITLHVPMNREGQDRTLGLAGQQFMERMKKGSVLINSSRGGVVNEQVLKTYMASGKFSAVVLDVYENEPAVDPEVLGGLRFATPHIAGYSADGKANGTAMVVQALSRKYGLGLVEWRPGNVPLPDETAILHDPSGRSFEESLLEIYGVSYDVYTDHRRLTENPELFEKLRGEYPLRREAPVYMARVFNVYPELNDALNGLGFNVLKDSCF